MQPLRVFSVIPKLPAELETLWFLAYNYWFAWNHDIEALFASVDAGMWQKSYKNPVWFLNNLPQKTLKSLAKDPVFQARVRQLVEALDAYLAASTPYSFAGVSNGEAAIAYFSLEFGVSLCLPIYSGGLGILAGDHLKSASDLNMPLVGIGLAYRQGYFRQYMTPDGWQQERYPDYDFDQMPLTRAKTPGGEDAKITMTLDGKPLVAQIFEAKVGRVSLYLLDTNTFENPPEFRQITARLYSGNLQMRLWQEILLGIGGMKALSALGLAPKVIHMNEGHSAFAGLERIRALMQEQQLPFRVAMEVAAAGSIFTTHTPVPAGNDRFPASILQPYFESYARELGLSFHEFLALGREDPRNDFEEFCMPVLALRISRFSNGVSKLHSKVSQKMWHRIWGNYHVDDVPIKAVTNGVHAPTWVGPEMGALYNRYLGKDWRESTNPTMWENAAAIPDQELWATHERMRGRLVEYVRNRLYSQMVSQGARHKDLQTIQSVLNPAALTIGFARRFATYKRAQLIMEDVEKLYSMVSNKECPVQFVFAGKAHPQDQGGKQILKDLIALCRTERFRDHLVFIEDYDMEVAYYLISGCDIWLNNPRRPLEACGTSGMKAMFNGVLQFSTLDGWWDEAWKPDNSLGWAIGKGEEYDDPNYQDTVERDTLYKVLESEIIPDFYDRPRNNIPSSWVLRMKEALVEFGPRFHSHRMVAEYGKRAYKPACHTLQHLSSNGYQAAKELADWRSSTSSKWAGLRICDVDVTERCKDTLYVGQEVEITARVFLNGIAPGDIQVGAYGGQVTQDNAFITRAFKPMYPAGPEVDGWQKYKTIIEAKESGRYGLTVCALPYHPVFSVSRSTGLLCWAEPGTAVMG